MAKEYEKLAVTVDIVVFTIIDSQLKVLLVKRNLEPYKDKWAIPGGFVRIHESLDSAAKRELEEETGMGDVYLEQLYSFGEPNRDPRGRVITVAYMALVNSEKVSLHASTDASEAQWTGISKLPTLAFDHKHILEYALKRLRWKFEYTTVAFSMLPEKFTLGSLQKLYEIVFQRKFDKRNFVKKIHSLNILNEENVLKSVSYRPPRLYSLKKNVQNIVEILRPQP